MLARTVTLPTFDLALNELKFHCQRKRLPDIQNWIKNWKIIDNMMGNHQAICINIYDILEQDKLLDADVTQLIYYNDDLYNNLPNHLQLNILLTGNILQAIAAQSSAYTQIQFRGKKRPPLSEITAYCDNVKKVVTTLAMNQAPNVLQDFIGSIKFWPAIKSIYNPKSELQMGIANALANQVINLILQYASPSTVNNIAKGIFYNEPLYNQLSHQSLMGLITKSDHFCVLLCTHEPKLERVGPINLINTILKSNHRFAMSIFINSKHLMKLNPSLLSHLLDTLIQVYGIKDSSCIAYTFLRKINLFFMAIPPQSQSKEKYVAQFVQTINEFYKIPIVKHFIELNFDFALIQTEYLLALILQSDEFCLHFINNAQWVNQLDETQIQKLFQERLGYMLRVDGADKIDQQKAIIFTNAFMQQLTENPSRLLYELAKLMTKGCSFQDCPPVMTLIESQTDELLLKLKNQSTNTAQKPTLSMAIFNQIKQKNNPTLMLLYLAYSQNHFESIYDLILHLEKSCANDEDFTLCNHLIGELWQNVLLPTQQNQIIPTLKKMLKDDLNFVLDSSVEFFINNIGEIDGKYQSILAKNLMECVVKKDNLKERSEQLCHLKKKLIFCHDQLRLKTTLNMIEHQISIVQSMMDLEAIPDFIFATSEPCSPVVTDIDDYDDKVPQSFDNSFLKDYSTSLLFSSGPSTPKTNAQQEPARGTRFKKKM